MQLKAKTPSDRTQAAPPVLPALLKEEVFHILILPAEAMLLPQVDLADVRIMSRGEFILIEPDDPRLQRFALDGKAAHALFRYPAWISMATRDGPDPLIRVTPRFGGITERPQARR